MNLGQSLRTDLRRQVKIEPFVGIFDAFSATVGSPFSNNLFYSGFGFAASYYGLPDRGYISWSDMVQAVWRIRQILPDHRMLVDIDDGYADTQIACQVARELEAMGVAMVMLEDQARGLAGVVTWMASLKLPLSEYLDKLNRVLDCRDSLCVLARTDASGDEIFRRVEAIQKTGADAILVDGITSVDNMRRVRSLTDKPIAFNQIAGGKSPRLSASELRAEGIAIHIYSTPMLFAALTSMRTAMQTIMDADGRLPATAPVRANDCMALLDNNLAQRRGTFVESSVNSDELVLETENY